MANIMYKRIGLVQRKKTLTPDGPARAGGGSAADALCDGAGQPACDLHERVPAGPAIYSSLMPASLMMRWYLADSAFTKAAKAGRDSSDTVMPAFSMPARTSGMAKIATDSRLMRSNTGAGTPAGANNATYT